MRKKGTVSDTMTVGNGLLLLAGVLFLCLGLDVFEDKGHPGLHDLGFALIAFGILFQGWVIAAGRWFVAPPRER